MRRLIHRYHLLEGERGVTTIFLALTMTLILGFVGLAVDIGASYAKKGQLQNGADAAALAIAQDHAEVDTTCHSGGDPDTWVRANVHWPGAEMSAKEACLDDYTVTVTGTDVQKHWFLPFVGYDQTTIDASATAQWGSPTSTSVTFPVTFSTCEFEAHLEEGADADGIIEINFTKDSEYWGVNPCPYAPEWPEMGNNFPGGFGFIQDPANTSDCTPPVEVGAWVRTKDGNSVGGMDCSFPELPFTALIPLFDDCRIDKKNDACREYVDAPDKGEYHIAKFAGFRISGYDFNASVKDGQGCVDGKPCIRGEFVDYTEVPPDTEIGEPDPDAVIIIRLIN